MQQIIWAIRTVCFFLSIAGYAEYMHTRWEIPYGYGIAVTAGGVISVLWLLGMLLPLTAFMWCIFVFGVLLFIKNAVSCHGIRRMLNWTNLFVLVSVICGYYVLREERFAFIDDFNHWATMARSVFENGALPDGSDSLIQFVSYPPGMALWISYFMTVTGKSTENMYLIAQMIFLVLMLAPLTVFEHSDEEIHHCALKAAALICAFMLCFAIANVGLKILTLCVEGVLAAAGIGGMSFAVNYKGSKKKKALFSIPLLIAMISIKDFGILFCAAALCYLCIEALSECKSRKEGLLCAAIPAAAAVIYEICWHFYVKLSFPAVASAPHSLSIDRWQEIFNERSPEIRRQILDMFLKSVFRKQFYALFLGVVFVLLALYLFEKHEGKPGCDKTIKLLVLLAVNHAVYFVGLLFVYEFSMEVEGALCMDSFSRYTGVEFCFMLGMCVSRLKEYLFSEIPAHNECRNAKKCRLFDNVRFKKLCVTAMCICTALILIVLYAPNGYYRYAGSMREKIHAVTHESYTGDALVYPMPVTDYDYYNQPVILSEVKYDFRSLHVDYVTEEELLAHDEKLNDYSHILIYNFDDTIASILRAEGWQGEAVPGVYRLENGKIGERESLN